MKLIIKFELSENETMTIINEVDIDNETMDWINNLNDEDRKNEASDYAFDYLRGLREWRGVLGENTKDYEVEMV